MSSDKVNNICKRLSVKDIQNLKNVRPVVSLTAYSFSVAAILDEYVDFLLVGDSLAMVLYGMENTLNVSLDTMIGHGKAVVRGSKKAFVVVDMPFGSYQVSKKQAFINCSRVIVETGCNAVKIEGGKEMYKTIKYLVERGIPVISHIGMKPQYLNTHSGYCVIGKNDKEKENLYEDAKAVEKAGAFAILVEGVKEKLASEITKNSKVPVIGIGASPSCDGQILVSDDLFGLFNGFIPKFAERYEFISDRISEAVKKFSEDVKSRKFPDIDKHCFK